MRGSGVLSRFETYVLHFGLRRIRLIKQVTVSWPILPGRMQSFTNLAVDRKFTLTEPVATAVTSCQPARAAGGQFTGGERAR